MNEELTQQVDVNSTEFREGVEAGLNSAEDTKNWKAGNELGQELKKETETVELAPQLSFHTLPTPLFLRDDTASNRGNAQDEKDTTEE